MSDNDDDLKRLFGELREADRRSVAVPPIEAMLAAARRLKPRLGGWSLKRRGLVAASITALLMVGGGVAWLKLCCAPPPGVAIASWTSPTASLMSVPGLDLMTTTGVSGSVVNLKTTTQAAKTHSRGDSI